MKKLMTPLCAIVLAFGFVACGGSMANLKDQAADSACEASCDEAKEECLKGCAGETAEGEAQDNAACELACNEAREKCVSDCKN